MNPRQANAGAGWLIGRFALGYARTQPWRAVIQVVAIATGVALGFAVNLINASALDEFSAAERTLSGKADLAVVGPAGGFDEALYARIANDPRVAIAAPQLDIDAAVIDETPRPTASSTAAEETSARGVSLRIVGIDVLRSALLSPDLVGAPGSADAPGASRLIPLLSEGLFLSPAALARLHRSVGQSLVLIAGDHRVQLPITGTLPAARGAIAAMDLGFAQWRFDQLGRLSRVAIKFAPGTGAADIDAALRDWQLPAAVHTEQPDTAATRDEGLSRSYRVNLNVLSMVALFTGAFLVFSLQSQAIVARRAQLALLRMLGATRAAVRGMLMVEAVVFGTAGAVLGLAGGAALAAAALRTLGGDLGGGYFSAAPAHLVITPESTLLFFLLGVSAAVGGAWLPAAEAGRQAPAPALKAGVDSVPGSQQPRAWTALGGFALAAMLVLMPPIGGIPLGAYGAVALLLVSTIALKPLIAPPLFNTLARLVARSPALARRAPAWLAATRLARLPRFAAVGAAGIVASFALMVAMATMVNSFRGSFDTWLSQILAADLYVRASAAGTSGRFARGDLDVLRNNPQVARAEFSRIQTFVLDPSRAPVALIARPLRQDQAAARLPLIGPVSPVSAPAVPVWVSEAMVDLYGARPGTTLQLPLVATPAAAGGGQQAGGTSVVVAGVWRDYARQGGSIVIDLDDYQRLTGDSARTDAALWLQSGANANAVAAALLGELATPAAQFILPGQIRTISLRLFDRSFQVTYLLEWAAIVIGLAGLATTFSAQAIARTREFGMLRHVGVTRRQVLAVLAAEATLVTLLAAALGLGAGLGIAAVLVHVVNPQSFHWTMEMRVPTGLLITLSTSLLLAAALTATLAGQRALSIDAVRAVKDDW